MDFFFEQALQEAFARTGGFDLGSFLLIGGSGFIGRTNFLDINFDGITDFEIFVADEFLAVEFNGRAANVDDDAAIVRFLDGSRDHFADMVFINLIEFGTFGLGDSLTEIGFHAHRRGFGKVFDVGFDFIVVAHVVFGFFQAFIGFFFIDFEEVVGYFFHDFLHLSKINLSRIGVDDAFDDRVG